MGAQPWEQAHRLYLEAEGLPADARCEFLDEACRGDAGLRAEVEAMLRADDDTCAATRADPPTVPGDSEGKEIPAGTHLGAWRIESLVGRGGMGEVYEAQRDDGTFELRAAVKVLKRGLDTDSVVARFNRERRILAQLDHPNIAHVLDAGVAPDGRPFLVMEYVEGQPITEYVRSRELSNADLLRLLTTACEAVQAAHAKHIVHRDLKPSNVLVTPQGQVKLLDFGIAKALTEEEADATRLAGDSMAMTPAYAAPEQLLGLPATPASDVYALGIILYQLLVERLPHARSGRSTTDVARNLDKEAIERPSTALRKDRGRLPEPLRLARLKATSQDLDLIVLKALHAEAQRRYANAHDLAEDLQRLLESRPVLARPDSLAYRIGRFTRRNRRALAQVAGAAAVVAVIAAGVLALQQRRHAAQAYREHVERLVRLGQDELKKNNSARAATYLSAAYSAGDTSVDVRYFLARAMPAVEALTSKKFDSTGTTAAAYTRDGHQVIVGRAAPPSFANELKLWDYDSGRLEWSLDPGVYPAQIETSPRSGRVLLRGTVSALSNGSSIDSAVLSVCDLHGGKLLFRLQRPSGISGFIITNGLSLGDPEMNRVVVIEPNYGAAIWDVVRNRELLRLPVPRGVASAEFSPDGTSVVTGSGDGTITIWNPDAGSERFHFFAQPRIWTAAFYVSRNRIATLNRAGNINLWDAADGHWLGSVGTQQGDTAMIELSPDLSKLFTQPGGRNPTTVWDLDRGGPLVSDTRAESGAFSPSGNWAVARASDGAPLLWSLASGQVAARLDGLVAEVGNVAFAPDSSHVLTSGFDAAIREWDLSRVKPYPLRQFALPEQGDLGERGLVWTTFDGQGRIVTGGADGALRIWDAVSGDNRLSLRGHGASVINGQTTPDRTRAITASADHTARVWDLSKDRLIAILQGGHRSAVRYGALSPDGKLALTRAENDPVAVLWNADTGAIIARLSHGKTVFSVGFSPDGSRAVTGSADGTARVWDARDGHALLSLQGHDQVSWARYTPDGSRVLTSELGDGGAKLWDARDGHLLRTLDEGHKKSPALWAVISQDSRYAALGADDGAIRLWDLRDGGVRHFEGLEPARYFDLAFSPDGQLLAGAEGNSGFVGLWSVASGRLLWSDELNDTARNVSFDPSGTLLVASGFNNYKMPLWDVSLETRDAATVAMIVDCKSPWVLKGEALESRPPHPESCQGAKAAPANR